MDLKLNPADARELGILFCETASFASSDKYRLMLQGVKLDRDADGMLRLIATDSFALAVITSKIDVPEGVSCLVDAKQLTAIGKALGKLKGFSDVLEVVITFPEIVEGPNGLNHPAALTVETPGWTLEADVIPADFPNWEMLVPSTDGIAEWPALAPKYLARFGKLDFTGLRFECYGALKATKITGHNGRCDFLGLLMPVRTS